MPVFKKAEDIFSICCNYIFLIVDHIIYHITGILKTLKRMVYSTGLFFIQETVQNIPKL